MSEFEIYEQLRKAKTQDQRWKILAQAIEASQVGLTQLATKLDLANFRTEIKAEIGQIGKELHKKMTTLTWRFFGGLTVLLPLILTLFKLVENHLH